MSIRFAEGEGPVLISAARPPEPGASRPIRTNIWLDPGEGRLLDRAASNEGPVRVLHVLYGSLMLSGVGRQIVGWVGVFMFVSSLTRRWMGQEVRGGGVEGVSRVISCRS